MQSRTAPPETGSIKHQEAGVAVTSYAPYNCAQATSQRRVYHLIPSTKGAVEVAAVQMKPFAAYCRSVPLLIELIVKKISQHCNRHQWSIETEPHVRHHDGKLYKPDLAIHINQSQILILDVQISWESPRLLLQTWENKRLVY